MASDEKDRKGDGKAIGKEGGNEGKDGKGGSQAEKKATPIQEYYEQDTYHAYAGGQISETMEKGLTEMHKVQLGAQEEQDRMAIFE